MNYVDEQSGPPPQGSPPHGSAAPPGKKTSSTAWIIVAGVLVGVVLIVGVFASLAIYGVRRYMVRSKQAEALAMTRVLGRGVAGCGEPLPPTSSPVPATPPAGKKYMSRLSDWEQPAFKCAHFAVSTPQYFSYQWVRASDTQGSVVALADLDGDGTPEQRIEVAVQCSAGTCSAAQPTGAL